MKNTKINQIRDPQLHLSADRGKINAYQVGFDYFLNPNDKAITNDDRKILYVQDPEAEVAFSNIKTDLYHSINFFIGFAGSGKSTTIRYYFNLNTNLPYINEDEELAVFPSFFDANFEEIDTMKDLAAKIGAMCGELEKKHPEINKDFYTNAGMEKFYDFISQTKPEILFNDNYIDFIGLSPLEQIKKRMHTAYQNFNISYEASRLKYYILNYCSKIKKIIIILDDIESLSYEKQCSYVRDYLSFYTCMTELPANTKRLTTNIIISLRPHTYRLLIHNHLIECYPVANVIQKNPIDIKQYFDHLLAFKTKTQDKDLELYSACHKPLKELCDKFGGKYAKMIINLTHYNVRETLRAFSTIINNRTWITRNQELQLGDPADSNYSFNNITVIRALACNEYKLYYNDDHSLIPNILYNTHNKDYRFLCLLILNYFDKRQHPDTQFGIDSETLQYSNIVAAISKIFEQHDKISSKDVESCLHYLYKKKVLRKSIHDEDVPSEKHSPEILNNHSILYLSSRGYELLDMFCNDSVLMELYREDMYRDYTVNTIQECSYILMIKRQQPKIFLDLLRIVHDMLLIETSYRDFAQENNTLELYYEAFGYSCVCEKLSTGIQKSIVYSSKGSPETDELSAQIDLIIKSLNQAAKLQ